MKLRKKYTEIPKEIEKNISEEEAQKISNQKPELSSVEVEVPVQQPEAEVEAVASLVDIINPESVAELDQLEQEAPANIFLPQQ